MVRDPRPGAPRNPVGRLVRRADPYPRQRRHHQHRRPGCRPGGAAWIAPENTRPGTAPDLGQSRRPRPSPGAHRRGPVTQQLHDKETDMATTIQTQAVKPPAKGAPMSSTRKTALVAGVFYLSTFISIPTLVLYGPVKNHRDWILSSGGHTGILVGGFLELIVALAGIGTAVTLYPVVKRQNEGAALGFVTTRVLEAAMIFTGVVSLLSLVSLRQHLGGTAGANAASLVTAGASHVAVYNWTFLLGQTLMPGINALLLGSLMYRSRLVPRVIPVLGLIGGPLLITAASATLFGGSIGHVSA